MSSPSPKTKATPQIQAQRLPPPSLFLGPPSRNASNIDLPSLLLPGPHASSTAAPSTSTRAPLLRTRTARNGAPDASPSPGLSPLGRPLSRHKNTQQLEGQRQADRTDALWAEMQGTLEEVELSAMSGTHVFGPEHSKALDDLRMAQIALAQAWARSEADEATETAEEGEVKAVNRGAGLLDPEVMAKGTETATGGSGSGNAAKEKTDESRLEEETEADILLARKRREANDHYFQRVNGGVLDVVAKLEAVAVAMRGVERESRDIWSDSESLDTSMG
ncbi:MAG: hypothetical protein M1835_005476 [Candelina submexicana]|nr:MAG: hypothetical protein M1835_005476 [Candelina submexicana]